MELKDKIALVTGSSRGIGKAIAMKLAEKKAGVIVNYKSNQKKALEVVEQIERKQGKAFPIQADVSQFQEVKRMVEEIKNRFQRIDILINNVGPFLFEKIRETSPAEWEMIINTNLNATFYCIKAVLETMREQRSGNIINIGAPNVQRIKGSPNTGAYASAKAGVVILAKTLAREEAKSGIRVNVINPGYIKTENYTEEMILNMKKEVPLGRLGKPEDIAHAVLFLLSHEAEYITGCVLDVNGGLWC